MDRLHGAPPLMVEGWQQNDYLILFDEEESSLASIRYGLAQALPGFNIVGLRGWDDFIVRDQDGNTFTVPTVPCDADGLKPYRILQPGARS